MEFVGGSRRNRVTFFSYPLPLLLTFHPLPLFPTLFLLLLPSPPLFFFYSSLPTPSHFFLLCSHSSSSPPLFSFSSLFFIAISCKASLPTLPACLPDFPRNESSQIYYEDVPGLQIALPLAYGFLQFALKKRKKKNLQIPSTSSSPCSTNPNCIAAVHKQALTRCPYTTN